MKCRNFFVAHYSYYIEVTLSKKMYLEFYSTTKKCFNVQEFLQTYSCIKFAVHLFIIKVKPMWFLYSMFMYRNCDFSLFFGWFFFFTYCILWWNSEISVIKKEIWDFLSCYYHNMCPLFKRHFSLVSSLIRTINTWTYMYFFSLCWLKFIINPMGICAILIVNVL